MTRYKGGTAKEWHDAYDRQCDRVQSYAARVTELMGILRIIREQVKDLRSVKLKGELK